MTKRRQFLKDVRDRIGRLSERSERSMAKKKGAAKRPKPTIKKSNVKKAAAKRSKTLRVKVKVVTPAKLPKGTPNTILKYRDEPGLSDISPAACPSPGCGGG